MYVFLRQGVLILRVEKESVLLLQVEHENSHTIHAPIVCFWKYVSLAGVQNGRENESYL